MKNCYILYNPKAGNGNGKFEAQNFDIIYCSGIQYAYNLKNKSITRYELYGDLLLGNNKERPISELIEWEEKRTGRKIEVL